MAKSIKAENLADALFEELTTYHEKINEQVAFESEEAVERLVKITKRTAPTRMGVFRRHIAGKLLKQSANGSTYIWYVKKPHYRLTHLLVHGHDSKRGRVPGNPFLHKALDTVLPDYEKAVKEAIKK